MEHPVNWLYRVLENDDDGDPLDFGAVSANSPAQAALKLHHHLAVDLDLDPGLEVRIYGVTYPTGVWKSDGFITLTIDELERFNR